ncbi:fatty acid-binding protein, brain-like [Megalobrama amblycephala]|uniref:fatty acid-binding protein, brain-like n=1 Tax=Megalobrama amblycephala TaxID=75352 RepID=UPI0020147994|nr:fatty acid-binding protein, brain-like [Megalobrama amblycephala]
MVDAFKGPWRLVDSQNFDEYKKAVGIVIRPTIAISQVYKKTIYIKLGKEFDEITADGREVKSTVTLEGDSLVHVQRWDGKETKIVREIKDDKMINTLTFEGVQVVCKYAKE